MIYTLFGFAPMLFITKKASLLTALPIGTQQPPLFTTQA